MTSSIADRIRGELRAAADAARAAGQQAYMKSTMPFLGVRVPEVRRIAHAAAKGRDAGAIQEAAVELWDGAAYREEHYAGMLLLAVPALRGDLVLLPLIERMIREGQWWDYTDELAHRLAELLDEHPAVLEPLLRAWSTDGDFWIRRSAIISQLRRGARTDTALLSDVIGPNAADREFFIRKAIGWALRDYARTDPAWVRDFARGDELSPLSRRGALKHLGAGE